MGDLGVVSALEGVVWFFAMGWNGERGFGGGDFVNGEHKLGGRGQVGMKRGCIGALMGEMRKRAYGGVYKRQCAKGCMKGLRGDRACLLELMKCYPLKKGDLKVGALSLKA